jgi:hypothetical protein
MDPRVVWLSHILYSGLRGQCGARGAIIRATPTHGLHSLGLDAVYLVVSCKRSAHLGLVPIGQECVMGWGVHGS